MSTSLQCKFYIFCKNLASSFTGRYKHTIYGYDTVPETIHETVKDRGRRLQETKYIFRIVKVYINCVIRKIKNGYCANSAVHNQLQSIYDIE